MFIFSIIEIKIQVLNFILNFFKNLVNVKIKY